MTEENMSLRTSSALGLIVADLFLRYPGLKSEDLALCKKGVELSWLWVAGDNVDPFDICEYIDGEINLPIRSTDYDPSSQAYFIIASTFLAVGLVAKNACDEISAHPTESVENFGENEFSLLMSDAKHLNPQELEIFETLKGRLMKGDSFNSGAIDREVLYLNL